MCLGHPANGTFTIPKYEGMATVSVWAETDLC